MGAGSRSAKLGAGRAHAARGEAGSQAAPDVGLVTARAVARPGRSHRTPFTAPAQGESGVGAAGQQSWDAPWDAGGPGTPHHTHGSPDATAGSPGMSAVKHGGERTGRPRHVPGPAGHPRGPDPQPHALGLAGWPSLQPSPAAQPSPAPPEHRPREQSGRVGTPGRAPPAPPPPARSRARAVYLGTAEHTEEPCCVRQPPCPPGFPPGPLLPPPLQPGPRRQGREATPARDALQLLGQSGNRPRSHAWGKGDGT